MDKSLYTQSYRYWQYTPGAPKRRGWAMVWSVLTDPVGLLTNYHTHWLQIYATLAAYAILLGVSLLLVRIGIVDDVVHHLVRYLHLIVITMAAYVLDQRIAVWLALFCTGIYLPSLVGQLVTGGWTQESIELTTLLISYNIFAVFASTLTAFGRDHRRLSSMIDGFENVFAQAFNLEKLPRWILESSVRLTDATAGALYLKETDDEFSSQTSACAYKDLSDLLKWVMRHDQVLNLSHVYNDPRLQIPPLWCSDNGNMLILPIRSPAQQTGLLVLWRYTNQFRKREEELLQLLVARGHLVIENARLHAKTDDALTQRANELAILLDASNTFSATLELDQLIQILARKLTQITMAAACHIYLVDGDTSHLVRHFTNLAYDNQAMPETIDSFCSEEYPFHHHVLNAGRPVLLDTATRNGHMTPQEYAQVFHNNLDTALFLPLIFQNRQLGIAVLTQQATTETFSEAKIRLSEAVVREAVVALSNAWAYHSLVEAHRRIQLLIDNVAEGVFSVDVKRRITDFNPAAEELTGYSASEARTLAVSQLLVCDEQHCLLCRRDLPLQDAVYSGAVESPSHCRAWIIQQDGRRRAVSHSVAPLMSSDQQVTGAVSVVRDISKEEELVRMKSEFIALVSHQLRTPLTNISMAAEMLASSDDHHEEDLGLLATLKQQSIRLRRLVDQVLMASRLEQGLYQKIVVEPLALPPLLLGTVRIFRTQHPEFSFPLSIPGDVSFVLGDQVLVEVVLENLIQNAIDHAQGVSEIAVTVENHDSQVLIEVADNGAGIPADEREEIFSPFHNGRDAGKRRRGFGLGLYLTQMAVEAQGGKIWVTPNEERGTCFHFTLNTLQGDL